jgi:hypothetical protein
LGQVSIELPGAPEYDDLRRPWAARFRDVRPSAIARCPTPGDVVAALEYARDAAEGRSAVDDLIARLGARPASDLRRSGGLDDTAYYGVDTGSLHRIRAKYDPEGVFG